MPANSQRYPEPTVGALILNRKGEVLLVKSQKWGDRYTVAGGHVEVGESLVGALRRELREEVGLEVYGVKFLMVQEAIFSEQFWKRRHFIFFDFVCRCRKDDVRVDGKEIQSHVWIEPRRAAKLKLDSYTRRLLRRFLSDVGRGTRRPGPATTGPRRSSSPRGAAAWQSCRCS